MCQTEGVTVTLRVEGKKRTIFEGPITTTFHRVTTRSGGTRHCNGLNGDVNTCPGPTCTTALDDGSKLIGFNFDGTYDESADDFTIKTIANETIGQYAFWSICHNFRPISGGGCQQKLEKGDEVLFAYATTSDHPNATKRYLRLWGPTFPPSRLVTLTVTDGNGLPIQGARINSYTNETDAYGKVTLQFTQGTYELKADKRDDFVSIRSNRLTLVVKP